MRATPSPTARPRPRRAVQLAVWALLAALLVGGVLLGHTGAWTAATHATPVASGTHILAGADGPAAQGVDPTISEMCKYQVNSPCGNSKATSVDNPLNLLPAWRWNGATAITSQKVSFWDALLGGGILASFANLFFALAAFLWWLLLFLLRYALTLSLVQQTAHSINSGAYAFGHAILRSSIIWIVLAVGLGALIRAALKGNLPRIVAIFFAFAVPIGGLQMMTSAAQGDAQAGRSGGVSSQYGDAAGDNIAVGSPAWLAFKGNRMVDSVSKDIGNGFGAVSALDASSKLTSINPGGNAPAAPNCDSYIATLYQTYDNYEGSNDSQKDLETVSFLWKSAYLDQWTNAQFGNTIDGSRIACHRLENVAGIGPQEQYDIATAQKKGGKTDPATGYDIPQGKVGPFLQLSDANAEQSQLFAWAACAWDGKEWAATNDAWKTMFNKDNDKVACKNFFTLNTDKDSEYPGDKWEDNDSALNIDSSDTSDGPYGQWDSVSSIKGAMATPSNLSANDQYKAAWYDNARQTAVAWYGGETSTTRLLQGVLAAGTAGVYGFALGGLAIGSIMAQVGLLVMLLLLPATLVALALPAGEKGKRNPLGVKLLRTTGGFFAGKLMLTTAMSMMITVIDILEGFLGSATGMFGALIHALIPLCALFVLKMLLKKLGLGDITKLSGAVGMAGAAALASSGDKNWARAGQNALANSVMGRTLDRADRAFKAPGRALKNAAGKEMDFRKKQLGHNLARNGLKYNKDTGQWEAQPANGRLGFFRDASRLTRAAVANRNIDQAARLKMWDDEVKDAPRERKAVLKYGPKGNGPFGKPGEIHEGSETRTTNLAEQVRRGVGGVDPTDPTVPASRFNSDSHTYADRDKVVGDLRVERRRLSAANKGRSAEEQQDNRMAALEDVVGKARASYQNAEPGQELTHLSDGQRVDAARKYAEDAGAEARQVLMGVSGLPPMIAPDTQRRAVKLSTDDATINAARLPENYLPAEVKQRGLDEDETTYHMRLFLESQQRGYRSETGEPVDVLKAFKIDVETAAGREEVLKAARGESSRLDDIKLPDLGRDAAAAIASAVSTWQANNSSRPGMNGAALAQIGIEKQAAEDLSRKLTSQVERMVKDAAQFADLASFGNMGIDTIELRKDLIKLADVALPPMVADANTWIRELGGAATLAARGADAADEVTEAGKQIKAQVDAAFSEYRRGLSAFKDKLNDATTSPEEQAATAKEMAAYVARAGKGLNDDLAKAVRAVEDAQKEARDAAAQARRIAPQRQSRSADLAGSGGSAPGLG